MKANAAAAPSANPMMVMPGNASLTRKFLPQRHCGQSLTVGSSPQKRPAVNLIEISWALIG